MRSCPKCKSSEYNNRTFTLMINECGHSLCKNCVELLFARGSAECPTCKRTLKKNSFWEQTFDDPQVERNPRKTLNDLKIQTRYIDVYFRKKLQKIYNLKEDDFPSLRAYNDYLEEYEALVFNLANDIDVEETYQKVDQFKKDHDEIIGKNRGKKSKDEVWIQQMLDEDSRFKRRITAYDEEATKNAVVKRSNEARAIIDELQKSDQPAAFIVINKQREQMEKIKENEPAQNSGLMDVERSRRYDHDPKVFVPMSFAAGEQYHYKPLALHVNGPKVPGVAELAPIGYLINIVPATPDQLGGGYHESYGCIRALTEARLDLFTL